MNEALIEAVAKAIAEKMGCERPWSLMTATAKNGAMSLATSALAAIEASGTHVVVPVKLHDGFLFSDEDWRDIITSLPKVTT